MARVGSAGTKKMLQSGLSFANLIDAHNHKTETDVPGVGNRLGALRRAGYYEVGAGCRNERSRPFNPNSVKLIFDRRPSPPIHAESLTSTRRTSACPLECLLRSLISAVQRISRL